MEMYSREEIADQKELRKRAKLAAVIVSVLAAAVCVFLLIFVRPRSEKLFRIIAIVCAAFAGCFDIYIFSFIMPYMRPKPKQRSAGGKVLHVLGNILRQMHMYIIWILLSGVIVSFLFNLATDTIPSKKVSIYADVVSINEIELETVLNEDLPAGIKMVKAHTFSYHTFGMSNVGMDDIYIVAAKDIDQYIDGFAPAGEFLEPRDVFQYYIHGGEPYGVLVKSGGQGMASSYIDYEDGEEYYMFFGKDCLHKGADGAAAYIAERLLKLK